MIIRKSAIAILLGCGLLYVFLTPPFKAPDEISHLLRAYSVAEGQWMIKDHPEKLIRFYLAEAEKWQGGTPTLRQHLHNLLDHRDGDRVSNLAFNTSLYSPVPYLLHVLVIKCFMVCGNSNLLLLLYVLRVCSLLVFIALLLLSFKLFPAGAWCLFWVAATPMALSQASVINLDYLLFGATAVLLSASLGNAGPRLYSTCMVGSMVVLLTAKLPYLPLLLIPVAALLTRKNHQRLPGLVAGMVAALAGGAWWNYLVKEEGIFAHSREIAQRLFQIDLRLDPFQQLSFIIFSPWHYCQVLFTTFATHGLLFFHQLVGVLGELDMPIPMAAVMLWLVGTLVVIFIREEPLGFNHKDSLILGSCCLAAAGATFLAVLTSAFMLWMPVGSTWINVQGRYFHPVMIAFLMGVLLLNPLTVKNRSGIVMQFGLLFLAVMIHGLALSVLVNRYGFRWSG
jgi:uncharacterized membrane protein